MPGRLGQWFSAFGGATKGDRSERTDEHVDPRASELAAALEANREARRGVFAVTLGVGVLVYVIWAFLHGAAQLTVTGEIPETQPWDAFGAAGWHLGLGGRTADTVVFAALALVAALSIASAATPVPPRGSPAMVLANWAGWVSTLTTVSFMAAATALAIASGHVTVQPRNAVLLILVAVVTCWLHSGIQSHADERINAALRHSQIEAVKAVQKRIRRLVPGIADRGVAGSCAWALVTPVLVGGLSFLPYLVWVWASHTQPLSNEDPVLVVWFLLFACLAIMAMWAATLPWSIWAAGKTWVWRIVALIVSLVVAAAAWVLSVLIGEVSGPVKLPLWIGLGIWAILTILMCARPRWSPTTQLLLLIDWRTSQKRLAMLEGDGAERTASE